MKHLIPLIIILSFWQLSFGQENSLRVTGAWARPVILQNRPGAAYFTIRNESDQADKLIRVSSLLVARIEMHENSQLDGVMRMRRVQDIPVGAHSTTKVEPGGYHLMLFGLKKKLAVGDELPLILTFVNAGEIEVRARVRKRAP